MQNAPAPFIQVRIAQDEGINAPQDLTSIQSAVGSAVQLGLVQPDRPITFGIQPVLDVNITFTDDSHIQQLNRDYRTQDKATDVLSFSQIEGDQEFVRAPNGALILGDIIISLETAQRQAMGSLLDELRLLAVHGALHLLGYDHETDEDDARMSALTKQALASSQ